MVIYREHTQMSSPSFNGVYFYNAGCTCDAQGMANMKLAPDYSAAPGGREFESPSRLKMSLRSLQA